MKGRDQETLFLFFVCKMKKRERRRLDDMMKRGERKKKI